MLPRMGWDWSHLGIASLFSDISGNGYDMLFLSSRAIAQASATRDYLHSLKQDGSLLPQGPVIISPDGLFPSLYRELVRPSLQTAGSIPFAQCAPQMRSVCGWQVPPAPGTRDYLPGQLLPLPLP